MQNNFDGLFTAGDAAETPATSGSLQGTAHDSTPAFRQLMRRRETRRQRNRLPAMLKSVATIEKENSVGESLVPVGAPDNPQVGAGPATLRQQRAPAAPVQPSTR